MPWRRSIKSFGQGGGLTRAHLGVVGREALQADDACGVLWCVSFRSVGSGSSSIYNPPSPSRTHIRARPPRLPDPPSLASAAPQPLPPPPPPLPVVVVERGGSDPNPALAFRVRRPVCKI